jgi:hypothetical protein
MMKRLIFCIFLSISLMQCRPDVIVPFEPYGPQDEAIYGLLKEAIQPNTITEFALQAPADPEIVLSSQFGSKITIGDPDGTFENTAAQPVKCSQCSDLKIMIKEAMNASQLIAHGLNLNATGIEIAEASGAVSVEVTCNGQPWRIRNDQTIEVLVPDQDPNDIMDMYAALISAQGYQTDWVKLDTSKVYKNFIPATLFTAYEFSLKRTGWTIGFRELPGTLHTICLDLDTKFNTENAFAYVVLKDSKVTVRMTQRNGQFCLDGVPQGLDATLFVVSKLGDTWQAVAQDFNTSDTLITPDMQERTSAEVVLMVQGL